MIIKDRQKEFVDNGLTVCQEECFFKDYNSSLQIANCSCQVKEATNSYDNMNINKTKLSENFEIKNDKMGGSNLGITSCDVFSSNENIKSNTGFFLLLLILAIFIIIFIIFCTKGYNLLENKIDEVIYKKFKNEKEKKTNKIKKSSINDLQIRNKINKIDKKKKKSSKKSSFSGREMLFEKKSKKSRKSNTLDRNILTNNKNKNLVTNIIKKSEKRAPKPDTDYELNWLLYEEAVRYDKRSNCEYYGSLLKSKQLFIFTFCSFNDYNSGIVKKFMFFLSFALHYTVNALFFTDSNMHQIYEDEGKFNFEYQISHILYSALISTFVLRMMLQFLVLTDKDVLEIKLQQTKQLAINMKRIKLKCMKVKFAIFFVLNFILLGLFWYYLTCFNAVYKNTQVYLIENTFISFGFSLFYPFIYNILPTIIRMCSIHSANKNQNYCYKVSQIIQLI